MREANSYDFVRFCAASSVLFSHHFDLAGFAEPLVPGYGEDFGQLGVQVFFCLSGFLICRSLQKSNDWALFFAARVLRIFPNLAFVLVVTSAATLIWYGNVPNLAAHVEYVADNLAMFVQGASFRIPGVFGDALRPAVNEPLWTLPYELWLYVLLFALFAVGGRAATRVALGALGFGALWSAASLLPDTIGPLESGDLVKLGSYFFAGALLAVFWQTLAPHALALGAAGLAGVFVVRAFVPLDTPLQALALAAATIGLGSARSMAWFAKGGDASYGIYVFGWPVQQFALLAGGSFWGSMGLAFAVAVAIGYATWHGFEKRALSQRLWLAERMRALAPTLSLRRKPRAAE